MIPKKHLAKLINKTLITWKILKLDFEFLEAREIEFKPGQFVSLKVSKKDYRAYSICSIPVNKGSLQLIIDVSHPGIGCDYVKNLKIGDEVELIGPSGKFCLRRPLAEALEFFATGTGIAPFIPMFNQLAEEQYTGKVRFYFGLRQIKDIYFKEQLDEFKKNLINFDYEIWVTKPEDAAWEKTGRITGVLDRLEDRAAHYYLCGNPNMINEVTKTLLSKGVTKEQICCEKYI